VDVLSCVFAGRFIGADFMLILFSAFDCMYGFDLFLCCVSFFFRVRFALFCCFCDVCWCICLGPT